MSSTLSNAIKPTHCIFYLSYYILLSLCFPHFKNSGVVLLHSLNINILRMFILHPYYIILLSEDPGGLPLWALAYKGLVSMHVFLSLDCPDLIHRNSVQPGLREPHSKENLFLLLPSNLIFYQPETYLITHLHIFRATMEV